VIKTFLSRLVKLLLALNYSEAAIVCEAVDDFCLGPEILEAAPGAVHRKVVALKKDLAPDLITRTTCLPTFRQPAPTSSRLRGMWHLVRCMSRHLFRASPAPDTPPGMVVAEEQARWWSFFRVDVIAVEDW
jgi:galactofuranosylgalactofuranosylrhamnosyl-N-acetylglucosaminyl-diphospho-decaprenol beta-1,5/1,6-galactofuranosyltransferase